jgi:hypothetical protein
MKQIVLLLSTLLTLTACVSAPDILPSATLPIPATETPTLLPTKTDTHTPTLIPTDTPVPTITWTPFSTILPDDVSKTVLNLMDSNADCELPFTRPL